MAGGGIDVINTEITLANKLEGERIGAFIRNRMAHDGGLNLAVIENNKAVRV